MSPQKATPGPYARRLEKSFVYRAVHKMFHGHLTDNGKLVFWVFLLSTSLSLFTFHLKAYIFWSGLISMCCCSILLSRLARKKLDIQVSVPDRVSHGQIFHLDIDVHNPNKRPARDLRVSYQTPSNIEEKTPLPFLAELSGGDSHRFTQSLNAKKRGAYFLSEVMQENGYTYGLWKEIVNQKV